jgi:hypothetical protein
VTVFYLLLNFARENCLNAPAAPWFRAGPQGSTQERDTFTHAQQSKA